MVTSEKITMMEQEPLELKNTIEQEEISIFFPTLSEDSNNSIITGSSIKSLLGRKVTFGSIVINAEGDTPGQELTILTIEGASR